MYSVIILDDNKATARQIEQTVPWAELNCNVLCVLHDGASGKTAIEQLLPDLIITDIEMPGLSGIEMLDLTKKLIPTVRLFSSPLMKPLNMPAWPCGFRHVNTL